MVEPAAVVVISGVRTIPSLPAAAGFPPVAAGAAFASGVCLAASVLALLRLRKLEPAMVFR